MLVIIIFVPLLTIRFFSVFVCIYVVVRAGL